MRSLLFLAALLPACATEARVQSQIDEAAFCEVAEDCVDIGSTCPFGCNILVNASEADRVSELIDRYERQHPANCVYDCAMLLDVTCEDNVCTAQYGAR